ncbi:DegV family protein [Acidaminobacter hydrogenoformans]|uniref:EDD domain protein, DegV family n=1 Tax=Acidaminobacter hydrogenoformans DSM 2784 TaxID=1120920 RepID=A0A1G5RTD8_9FIRM|nr:DegV family protein [Acidaminobacter hydrogenoformans]SCZ77256.1 EDD domain protein, DegV family [Acidaminobacter hydrogenoformans DSM 2784]
MGFKIIADSSNDMTPELQSKYPVEIIPFKLTLDGREYVDDAQLDPIQFITDMSAAKDVPRSACPSPNDFLEAFEGDEDCFVVTISSKLSGTYNSAQIAKEMYLESHPDKKIHLVDSKAASIAETLISMKLHELIEKGLDFNEIIEVITGYVNEMKTFFVSESLDNLIKNGRISKLKGVLATALSIKPIMGAEDGEIRMFDKARGSNKAFDRLVEMIMDNAKSVEDKILAISHVNNPTRAAHLKAELQKRCGFKDIIVVQTRGLSSLYCDRQGIIVSF